jgi:hypothetical protein
MQAASVTLVGITDNRTDNCDRPGCTNLKMIDPDSNPPLTLCRKRESFLFANPLKNSAWNPNNTNFPLDYDESRNPPEDRQPKTPAPAPAPAPLRIDRDLEDRLDAMKSAQRVQRDMLNEQKEKIDDILRILRQWERRL